MQDFQELQVWQKSHQLALQIYRVTRIFPREELYGLTSQIRRCASSIGANTAEGCCRQSSADFARFLQIACGSAGELECHTLLARDLEMLKTDTANELLKSIREIKRMLTGLINRVRQSEPKNRTA